MSKTLYFECEGFKPGDKVQARKSEGQPWFDGVFVYAKTPGVMRPHIFVAVDGEINSFIHIKAMPEPSHYLPAECLYKKTLINGIGRKQMVVGQVNEIVSNGVKDFTVEQLHKEGWRLHEDNGTSTSLLLTERGRSRCKHTETTATDKTFYKGDDLWSGMKCLQCGEEWNEECPTLQ